MEARGSIHFILTIGYCVFFIVHIIQVIYGRVEKFQKYDYRV